MYAHVYDKGVEHTWYKTYNADAITCVLSMCANLCDQGVDTPGIKDTTPLQTSRAAKSTARSRTDHAVLLLMLLLLCVIVEGTQTMLLQAVCQCMRTCMTRE